MTVLEALCGKLPSVTAPEEPPWVPNLRFLDALDARDAGSFAARCTQKQGCTSSATWIAVGGCGLQHAANCLDQASSSDKSDVDADAQSASIVDCSFASAV